MKKCCKCKKKLLNKNFSKDSTRDDGLYPQCKKCKSYSNLGSYKKRNQKRKNFYSKLKINGCAICGYSKCSAVLSFHHVNPQDKKFAISNGLLKSKYTEKECVEEINKCILLCANCHLEIHHKEGD